MAAAVTAFPLDRHLATMRLDALRNGQNQWPGVTWFAPRRPANLALRHQAGPVVLAVGLTIAAVVYAL